MNAYTFQGEGVAAPSKDDLRALGLLFLFGDDFTTDHDTPAGKSPNLHFKLPFALTNLTLSQVVEDVYDSASQNVNEYTDKPYPVKGYLVVCYETPALSGTTAPDMDNFIRVAYYDSVLTTTNYIYIGLSNASQTQFYTPFSGFSATQKVFFSIPQNAYLSAQNSILGQSGVLPTFTP